MLGELMCTILHKSIIVIQHLLFTLTYTRKHSTIYGKSTFIQHSKLKALLLLQSRI